jgi:hypothetical protein
MSIQAENGTAEIQSLKIMPLTTEDFVLNFDGANTG